MTYQPGVGIHYTAALTIPDIGNVPNPQRVRNPAGTQGRMNGGDPAALNAEGTIYYSPRPSAADVDDLADLMGVGVRAVQRWFGLPDANGRIQFRNCVPIRSSNLGNVPGALGTRLCLMNYETRRRCILAACLTDRGGIYRDPLYTATDKKNGGLPYLMRTGWDTLSECVEDIEQLIDGDTDYILMVGWVQITIEPIRGGGWTVAVYHNYPRGDEYKEKTIEGECPA